MAISFSIPAVMLMSSINSMSLSSSSSLFFCNHKSQPFLETLQSSSRISNSSKKRRGLSCTCLFDLGVPELIVIAGVTALVFDPKKLSKVGRSIVHVLNKLPFYSKSVGIREGVVFLTYNSLIASSEKGQIRLQQLEQWCGPDYDGLVIFDEVFHAMSS